MRTKTEEEQEVVIKIDIQGDVPIYLQIRNQILLGVAKGSLQPGEQLPTVRQLAADIGVNPMTVNKAYGVLKDEGIIVIDRRHGAKIGESANMHGLTDGELKEKLELIVSEAMMSGISREKMKIMVSELIEKTYKREGE